MRKILVVVAVAIFLGALATGSLLSGKLEHAKVNYWKGGYCVQKTVDMSKYDEGIIRAKVDGKWQEFKIREFPEKFMKWNIERRLEALDIWEKGEMPSLSGPHNGILATHGIKRLDTQFKINNAVKGFGFLPRKEKLDEVLKMLKDTWDSSMAVKFNTLRTLYKNADEYLDKTKQVSLELYSTPDFETGSFLNMMTNPGVSVVFLDIPSFEFKAIAQLLHPDDPNLTDYEKKVVEFVNTIHDYIHGHSPRKSIVCIFHVIEVFDNTPPTGRGVRIVP